MSLDTGKFFKAARNRMLATILQTLESEFWDEYQVSPEDRTYLRQKVLSAVNAYYDQTLDALKALDA